MTAPLAPAPPRPALPAKPRYGVHGTKSAAGASRKKVLFWGLPFTGKTTYAKSFPGAFFIYFDPEMTTLLSDPTEIPYVVVNSKAVMDAVVADVKGRRLTEVVRSFGPQWADYTVETVIVDSSTFQDAIIEEWLDSQDSKGINRWDIKSRTFKRFYDDLVSGAEYKEGAEQYYVVVTAHEAVKKDKEGNVLKVTTCISGGFDDKLIQYMDTVIFCEVVVPATAEGKAIGGPKYIARTSPPDKWRKAGARGTTKFPPVLEAGAFFTELMKFWE